MPILEFSRLLASSPQDITAWMQTKNLLAAAKVCALTAKLLWCCHPEVTGVMATGMQICC